MKKIYINRKKWGMHQLWHLSTDTGCCLGHLVKQLCHLPKRRLNFVATPITLNIEFKNPIFKNKSFINKAVKINDSDTLKPKEKEVRLKKLFKKYNFDLVFYGK